MTERCWPKVTIAVLNRDGRKWLQDCLDSVLRADYPDLDVLLVDNGSTDGSLDLVRSTFPQVRVLPLERNTGFTGAYNRAFEQSDAGYMVLLNNDTVVPDPGWVRALVDVMDGDSSIAAAACKMLYLHDSKVINSLGGNAFWWTGSYDVADGEADEGQYDAPPIEPFSFCGGAAMLRMPVVREVGGFDDALFAYREDFDLSWRLRLRGHRVVYVPDARILHVGGGTWGAMSYGKLYLSSRNWLRLMLKNYSLATLLRALPMYLALEFFVRLPGLVWVNRSLRFVLMPFHNLLWNLAYLGDTLRARRRIQRGRRVPDSDILRDMGPRGGEPVKHLHRRAKVLRRNHKSRNTPTKGSGHLPS